MPKEDSSNSVLPDSQLITENQPKILEPQPKVKIIPITCYCTHSSEWLKKVILNVDVHYSRQYT